MLDILKRRHIKIKNIQQLLAKVVSGLFNPLLIPTYSILILFNSGTNFSLLPYHVKEIIFIVVLITTCLLPLAFLPLFMYQNLLKSLKMMTSRERIVPYVTIGTLHLTGYFILTGIDVPIIISGILLASAFIIYIALLITLKWKISAHMSGIGGLTGAILVFSFTLKTNLIIYLLIVLFIAGLLGTARLVLNHHTPGQIYSGFGLGLSVFILTYLFL